MIKKIDQAWAQRAPWLIALIPLSWVYGCAHFFHRWLYESGLLQQVSFDVPVVVIGNIMVGGTGKTPAVIAYAKHYLSEGKRVGVISRGYRAGSKQYPFQVKPGDDANEVGDEPLLIAEESHATVVCDPNRIRGIEKLISLGCNFILCDDGLQHYRLKPSKRIVVHPADWQGSTYLLPAGPFREPLSRLKSFDEVILMDEEKRSYACMDAKGNAVEMNALPKQLTVVVGIAQPDRLLRLLDQYSIQYAKHIFPDHHAFRPEDFEAIKGPILMTTKDWIKCRNLSIKQDVYVIGYSVQLPSRRGEYSS